MLYGELIHDHYRHPRNHGSLENPDIRYEDYNPLCGDRIRIEAKLDGEDKIADIKFRGDACIISQAASSILTDMVKGWAIAAVDKLEPADIFTALGTVIRPARTKCALLSLQILQSGIASYRCQQSVKQDAQF